MRKVILLSGVLIMTIMLATAFSAQPASAAETAELMPMVLDGTQWTIEVASVNKKGAKETKEDTLIFEGGKFISEKYKKDGYEPTNYSLTLDEDEATNFGTMQIKDKETTFWKGKVREKKISGSIHVQRPSGNNVTSYYKGTLSEGALKRKSKAKPVVQAPPPPPPAPPVAAVVVEEDIIIENAVGQVVEESEVVEIIEEMQVVEDK